MTRAGIEKIKSKLEERARALQKQARLSELSGEQVNSDIISKLAENEANELVNIKHALSRIKQGTYGACEGCDTQIPLNRLKALPFASYCVTCQQEIESGTMSPGERREHWDRIRDNDDPEDFDSFKQAT